MTDNLILCPRCEGADALAGQVCFGCQRELVAHHDNEIGWREAWQREQDEELREAIERDPDCVRRTLAALAEVERGFGGDAEMLAMVAASRAEFVGRVERVTQ